MALTPPASPTDHTSKSKAQRLEYYCCKVLAYFPLSFVYGLTTWAVLTELRVSFLDASNLAACIKAALGLVSYALANGSYTVAVFTCPGSPLDVRRDWSLDDGRKSAGRGRGGYDVLPTEEQRYPHDAATPAHQLPNMTAVTAKSTGKQRFCKKCQTLKPDRTHHCSSCGRCVLKMDHHCPWLATCVGLHNYKPFLLFLFYTCVFCWLCFVVTGSWVWAAISDDERMRDAGLVVNTILLAVLSGIIGLVLSGFTAWHGWLVLRGETTIESLEKTRYLTPLRRSMERSLPPQRDERRHDIANPADQQEGQTLLDQLKEIHANALPGVLRPDEGEESIPSLTDQPATSPLRNLSSDTSPAKASLQNTYASLEAQREQDRYSAYLDEVASESLPNAFTQGWKKNFIHVFGTKPWLWGLPVCNTTGDGWSWDISPAWVEARAAQAREREARGREEEALRTLDRDSRRVRPPQQGRDYRWVAGQGFLGGPGGHHQRESSGGDAGQVQMLPLDRRKGAVSAGAASTGGEESADSYDTSSDEDRLARKQGAGSVATTANWNDVPEDFFPMRANGRAARSRSAGREKGD